MSNEKHQTDLIKGSERGTTSLALVSKYLKFIQAQLNLFISL